MLECDEILVIRLEQNLRKTRKRCRHQIYRSAQNYFVRNLKNTMKLNKKDNCEATFESMKIRVLY